MSDETAWHDHTEAPGAGRDGWRFTSAERRALLALVKAAGPVRVMDVTTETGGEAGYRLLG